MEIRPVATWPQALQLAGIRNQCREFMTGDQAVISTRQQARWWARYHQGADVQAWLGWEGQEPVAFGLVRDGATITGGLVRRARGRNLGRELFAFLTAAASKPAHLEVLASNERAAHLYVALGWRPVREFDGPHGHVIEMTHA